MSDHASTSPRQTASPCTVVSTDFLLVGQLGKSELLSIERVVPRLRSDLAPTCPRELLIIDVHSQDCRSIEEFLTSDTDFTLTVLLVRDESDRARWHGRGATVASVEQWLGGGTNSGERDREGSSRVQEPVQRGDSLRRQTLVVFSPKGGVGRTTLAVNLAVRARSALGLDTVLVDLDIAGGDAALHLNLLDEPTIVDLAAYGEDLSPELLRDFASVYRPSGLAVLPAPGRPELAELAPWERLAPVVRSCQRAYDLVVIDTSGDPASRMNYHALGISTYILAPVTPEPAAPRRLRNALKMTEDMGWEVEGDIRLVINRHYDGAPLSSRDIETFFGMKAVARFPELGGGLAETISAGRPLVLAREEDGFRRAVDAILEDALEADIPRSPVPWWRNLLKRAGRWRKGNG